LLDLAQDTQEEFRHLVRLLANSHQASAVEILEFAVLVQRRMEAVTAGVVLMARRRRIPWEALGQVLSISPETARHTYHERHVKRRLDQHTPPPPAAPTQTDEQEDNDGQAPAAPPPGPPPLRVANQLAPVLSQMQKASGLPLRQLGLRAQVSASYLSRVLSGEKFPTWDLTEKIALALGADTEAVLKVWEDERARNGTASRPPASTATGTSPDAASSLPAALRTIYQRAGCPSPHSLAVATGMSAHEIRKILQGQALGNWTEIRSLILALDGEPSFFRPHWEEAQQAQQEAPPPAPSPADTPTQRLNRLLTTFSDAFHDPRTLPPSAGLSSPRGRELRRRLALAARTST
ncbi:helix-turn-helix domain-containing protein, partial [Streptomyces sp. IB201691-2A2]|uniref:helix-turn-helix domain-containing protein n=1 Tax=Streptomyces sp. IB201691-2A2 TaxID=2561920 RepID=UPI00163DDDBC